MSYYVFALPRELVDTLIPRTLVKAESPSRVSSPSPLPVFASQRSIPSAPAGSKLCNICLGSAFADVDDQRAHFKSDWHRYNIKLRLRGEHAITEAQFSSLIEGLEDSLSGSASSSDEENDDQTSDVDTVQTLLNKTRLTGERSTSPTEDNKPQLARNPIIWFHSPQFSTQIGIYRLLYPQTFQQPEFLPALKNMQHGGQNGRRWLMLMVAGGHFAGMLVQVQSSDELDPGGEASTQRKNKHRHKAKSDFEILKHKTFHRYTTRRKQGGSQSVNDNAKGFAKSAGALLRRYGEQALRDDIRNLMTDWAEDIAACEMIWIRASVSNRRLFYDYDEAVFQKGDERLRNFPFPTRRPTLSELTRCLNELTKVKVSHLTEEELRAQDEAYIASLPKPKPKPVPPQQQPPVEVLKPSVPRITKEEEARLERWDRLIEMVKKGRLEAFQDMWSREGGQLGGIDSRTPHNDATLLHISAASGQEGMTQYILEKLHADPTIPVTGDGEHDDNEGFSDTSDAPPPLPAMSRRVAYDLAKTRAVRNVFRRCAALHPDQWDWLGAARIPSMLSPKMEEERDERKKQRRKGLKDKIKERQAKQAEIRQSEEAEPEPTPSPPPVTVPSRTCTTGPRRLGGASGAQESVIGLTPEMRAKVERERRARAAEARLKALGTR